jgi:hypothetical protein
MKGRLVVMVGVAALVGAAAAAGWASVALVGPRSGSFVSLWEPYGAHRLAVEQFSLRTGKPLARLAYEPNGNTQASAPYPDGQGELWITKTSGPRCSVGGFGGCVPYVPNSCRSKITRLDPATGTSRELTTFPHSELVSAAIPSLRGPLVALVTSPCTTPVKSYIVVESRRTHRHWSIGADAHACSGLSTPAWNAAGTLLVFGYSPTRPKTPWDGFCSGDQASAIVIVSALHPSRTSSWHLIRPRPHCYYQSASFDNDGVIALLDCSHSPWVVVQMTRRGRLRSRIPLPRGQGWGSVLSDRQTGVVLVTGYDMVWQLQNHRLRLIAKYPPNYSSTFAAQPW